MLFIKDGQPGTRKKEAEQSAISKSTVTSRPTGPNGAPSSVIPSVNPATQPVIRPTSRPVDPSTPLKIPALPGSSKSEIPISSAIPETPATLESFLAAILSSQSLNREMDEIRLYTRESR